MAKRERDSHRGDGLLLSDLFHREMDKSHKSRSWSLSNSFCPNI